MLLSCKVISMTHFQIHHLVSLYNRHLKDIYYTVAPIQPRWIAQRSQAPWYNQDLLQVKREKRRLERKLKKIWSYSWWTQLESKCAEYNSFIETTKAHFCKFKIEHTNQNQLFRLIIIYWWFLYDKKQCRLLMTLLNSLLKISTTSL